MKLNNPQGVRGSFGIPDEVREAEEKRRAAAEKQATPGPQTEPPATEEWPIDASLKPDNPDTPDTEEPTHYGKDPRETLRNLGIEPTDEDFFNLVYRGTVEKTIPILTMPNGKQLTAKVKALTAAELDIVDELLAEDIQNGTFTRDGADIRKTQWIMAFAIQELSGKALTKPILTKEGKPDFKEMARAKRQVITQLSPFVLDAIVRKHADMVVSFNTILAEPGQETLKK